MSELGKTHENMQEHAGEIQKQDIQETERPKLPEKGEWEKLADSPFHVDTSVYDDVIKQNGLVTETTESDEKVHNSDTLESDNDHSAYLEKGDDGKYYDKETGKSYESVEQWEKAQETLLKRYESIAKYFEDKAKKEWARFKNSEANGETPAEKWEHYRKSQEYYAKAKENKEKAQKVREKLGESSETKSLGQDEVHAPLKSTFETVPNERRADVIDAFQGSPEGIKKVVDSLEDVLHVEDSPLYINEDGTISYGTCCYSPGENIIYMNPEYDNDEYAEVFLHEYGHFADTQLGDVSGNFEFVFALDADIDNILTDDKKAELINELGETDAIYDRSVSDILSGAFLNDNDIMMKYYDEGAPYYSHSNEYWEYGPENAREKEVFANLFRIYATSENADSKAFVEKYFPNTCEQFKSILSI